MIRARLVRGLRSVEAPRFWLTVAWGSRLARAVGPGRQRWSARTGYALRRAGRYDRAAAAYVEAIGDPGADPDGSASPEWYYGLGLCLRKRGDSAGAAHMLRQACRSSRPDPRWLGLLVRLEEEAGNLPGAVAVQQRLVERVADTDPEARLKLAALYHEAGQWDQARRLITENLDAYPEHAPSHKLLAEVLTELSRWGGTFMDTLSGRAAATFRFDPELVPAPAPARSALERVVELDPGRVARRVDLADARLADGDLAGAIEQYEIALRAAAESDGRWVLGAKHRWQFRLEHAYHKRGEARVVDPLFACELVPVGDVATGTQPVAGFFQAQFTQLGMKVTGFVAAANCPHVDLLLDGVLLRAVNVSRDAFFPEFSFHIMRKTLALFPKDAELSVGTPDGDLLRAAGGAQRLRLSMPHGDGRLRDILAGGGKIDKKGAISPTPEETRQRQDQFLEVYAAVRDHFEEHLGRAVFLMYGTLLGYHREGDFIPDDDDFDAGYISDRTDPVTVKEETKQIIVGLVRAGFTVSFNPRGRLFRVQLGRVGGDGRHIDLRPVWFQDGNCWAHNHVCLPLGRADFLPVAEGTLRGVRVAVPAHTEAFLRGHYGPGWKVPDPGFTYYASEVAPAVRQNLAKALITVAEYKELAGRIAREVGDSPEVGRFVSIGSQDLYPLEDLIT